MTLRYYSTEEAAKLIGIGTQTLRDRINRGEIRWIDVGAPGRPRVRISEEDLEAWMESQASEPRRAS